MAKWKSRGGKNQTEEKRRRQKVREEKESEVQKCEPLCFLKVVAPEGGKIGSLKRRGRSHLAR